MLLIVALKWSILEKFLLGFVSRGNMDPLKNISNPNGFAVSVTVDGAPGDRIRPTMGKLVGAWVKGTAASYRALVVVLSR